MLQNRFNDLSVFFVFAFVAGILMISAVQDLHCLPPLRLAQGGKRKPSTSWILILSAFSRKAQAELSEPGCLLHLL
jgi:hypothetical protein